MLTKENAIGWIAWIGFVLFPLSCPAEVVAISAGYAAPKPIDVAPGQVITLFVQADGKTPSDPVSANPPLPATLAGFSVGLRQSFPSDPLQAPIFSVADTQSCSNVLPPQCTTVSMITVQIPFELTPNVPRSRMPENLARLEITYNDSQPAFFPIHPVPDSIHVLNSCDAIPNLPGSCLPMVTHADGSLVSQANPAGPGETLQIALVGLGQPVERVTTGSPSPQPPPSVDGVLLGFDARANASPSSPLANSSTPPNMARLRAGAIGIYEVSFTVPSLPSGTPGCSTGSVQSNLTVSISRAASFDGVGICVDPGQ